MGSPYKMDSNVQVRACARVFLCMRMRARARTNAHICVRVSARACVC